MLLHEVLLNGELLHEVILHGLLLHKVLIHGVLLHGVHRLHMVYTLQCILYVVTSVCFKRLMKLKRSFHWTLKKKASFLAETSVPNTTKSRQNSEKEQYKRWVKCIVKAGLIHVVDTADSFCCSGHEYSLSIKLFGWNRERLWFQAE